MNPGVSFGPLITRKILRGWSVSRERSRTGEGAGAAGATGGAGVAHPGEKEAWEDLLSLHSSLTEGGSLEEIGQGARDSMKENGRGLSWTLGKSFFMEKVIKHWHRLPRAMMESPSLEGFKIRVDVALRGMG